ncbi:MAG: hypothetical protein HY319_05315 [Armatimonadetes bacterium]|nr:hypothetical protein [Armatimonadota bacterium]
MRILCLLALSLLVAGCSSQPAPETTPSPTPESVSGSAEYLQTAQTHFKAGQLEDAATFARLAVDMGQAENAPETVNRARLLLARTYQKQGQSQKALGEYAILKDAMLDDETRQAVKSDLGQYRQKAAALLQTARQKFAQSQYRKALADGKAALSMFEAGAGDAKQIAQARGLVGRCHAKLGEAAEARKYLQEALAATPGDPELKRALAATAPPPSRAPLQADARQGEDDVFQTNGAPDINRAKDYVRTRLPKGHNVPIPGAPAGLSPVAPVTY